jgi:prepilin-type N-terminal cleavage/methylation domain-containing protein
MQRRCENGFTLIEVLVVTSIVAIVAGTLGTFFLAGASPAVASAGRDVAAAFDEARRAALADDAATVVFAPSASGTGYTARVYRRFPGDAAFAPRNGPAYESTVTIAETAAPLGAPGFAFAVASSGTVTGFVHFAPDASVFGSRPCPAGGAFVLHLTYERDARSISVPCRLPASSVAPLASETPPAAPLATPFAPPSCPATENCAIALLSPPAGATCPPGYDPDPTLPGVCDIAVPSPAPTSVTTPGPLPSCPPGESGVPPGCVIASPPAACAPGAADEAGFASCLESDPLHILGPGITHSGCGTHIPIADPGGAFTVVVDVFHDGGYWGSYAILISEAKSAWLDFGHLPPSSDCGLKFSLAFGIQSINAVGGNAQTTPHSDTGDPTLTDQGVGSIVHAPLGAIWGSDT